MSYENNRMPNKKIFQPINARVAKFEYVTDSDGEGFFRAWLRDAIDDLNAGDSVLAFHSYQLKALQERYGSNLQIRRNADKDWWSCRLIDINKVVPKLNKHRAKRDDVTIEEVRRLANKGLRVASIAKKLKCSEWLVRTRLGGKK